MTCDDLMPGEPSRGLVVTPEEMETIELGLVVIVQRERRIADSFQSFVRPRLRGSVQRSPQSSRVSHIQERGLAIRSRAELIDHPSLRFAQRTGSDIHLRLHLAHSWTLVVVKS